jgi:4-amino-4-deoxy-L-arabinose transferase-like glycosyltransferase
VSRRRRPRGDPLRSCFVLWGGWLATLAVTFSVTTTLNSYYTAPLTPAVAALLGAGAAAAWSQERSAAGKRIGLAVGLIAGSLAPAVASAALAARDEGAFDTPFESTRVQEAVDATFLETPAQVKLLIPRLESIQNGRPTCSRPRPRR